METTISNFFLHNWLADMPGVYYLFFYSGYILSLIGLGRLYLKWSDTTLDELPPASIPQTPAPYATAWLRGGVMEVVRLAIARLAANGYVHFDKKKLLQTNPEQELPEDLNEIEKIVYRSVDNRFSNWKIGKNAALRKQIVRVLKPEMQNAYNERLLWSKEETQSRKRVQWLITLSTLALGAYKCSTGIIKGYPVAFLVILIILGTVLAFLGAGLLLKKHTRRGRRYLQDLKTAFADIKPQARREISEINNLTKENTGDETHNEKLIVQPGDALRLAGGIYGVSFLAGAGLVGYNEFLNMNRAQTYSFANNSDGAMIGSSCSSGALCSSGDGASSCSGGASCSGGSCGGGGCGGCGSS